jgi:rhodanese-related sulfurtransferase
LVSETYKTESYARLRGLAGLDAELPPSHLISVLHVGHEPQLHECFDDAATQLSVPDAEAVSAQLERRFAVVTIAAHLLDDDEGRRRAVLHTALMHVDRAGLLLVSHRRGQQMLCEGFRTDDLILLGIADRDDSQISVFRRGERTTVHDLLYEARDAIKRYAAADLARLMQSDNPPLVLDTRTHIDRGRFGVIAGAVHVPRTVLEWHLDPANGYLHPAMRSFEQPLVVVCNGGYSSSLAAANLGRLGFSDVGDLIGGFLAWQSQGFPVARPDHSHLDIPGIEPQADRHEHA